MKRNTSVPSTAQLSPVESQPEVRDHWFCQNTFLYFICCYCNMCFFLFLSASAIYIPQYSTNVMVQNAWFKIHYADIGGSDKNRNKLITIAFIHIINLLYFQLSANSPRPASKETASDDHGHWRGETMCHLPAELSRIQGTSMEVCFANSY